jgi:hypothetical protein
VHAAIALHTSDEPDCNLPVITKHDRRFANGSEHETVETETLSQDVIVGIVRERLDALLKVIPDTLEAVREREQRERELIEIRTKK